MLDRPAHLLFLCLLLISCSPNSSFGPRNKECPDLRAGDACSAESPGNELHFELKSFGSGQEFLIFVQSNQKFDLEKDYRIRFRLSSNIGSTAPDEEERRARTQLQHLSPRSETSGSMLNQEISLPSRFYRAFESISEYQDFYIPHLSDYQSQSKGELIPRYFRDNDNPQLSGTEKTLELIHRSPGLFEILMDPQFAEDSTIRAEFEDSSSCIEENLDQMMQILGRPIQLNTKKEIEVLVSMINGGAEDSTTIGLFNRLDRFRKFKDQIIPDSNYGEILYISPAILPRRICTTTLHEYQHLLSFDAKVLSQLSKSEREHLESMEEAELFPEVDGINEAASSLVEILSGEYQEIFKDSLLKILREPHLASFALALSNHSVSENFRSRGLNTLFLLHALKRAGGSYDWNDPQTQAFLRHLVLKPKIGFENIADYFDERPSDVFEGFYKAWAMSLYSPEGLESFIPEPQVSSAGVTQGFRILGRNAEPTELADSNESFHPLQTDLPFLARSQSWVIRPEALSVFRLIVPETLNVRQKEALSLQLSSGESPFGVFIIRVR